MVQRKQARKKPKDLVAVADDRVSARGAGDNASRGGGGVHRASLPSYMRPTSSSDARVGRAAAREAPPKPKPKPQQPVGAKAVLPRVARATCSSTVRGGPGPVAGADEPRAAAAAHVCSYSYCSVKDHVHASSVVPLSSFLRASRRRLIKTKQSMKLNGASPFRKPAAGGCFVEIRVGASSPAPTVCSDACCSDLSAEEEMDATARRMEYVVTFDHRSCGGDDAEGTAKSPGASEESSCASSEVISDGSVDLQRKTKDRGGGGIEQETLVVDHEDFGACKSEISEELDVEHIPQGSCGDDAANESSIDGISSALSGVSFDDVDSDCADAPSSQSQGKKMVISRKGRTPEKGGEQEVRRFKPKAPNFLPAEIGPEAEKVVLRHCAMNDRRSADEWMVDYALGKAVRKLARAQKRKVETLVQAFETVLPLAANEKTSVQDDDHDNRSWPPPMCS